MLVFTKFDPPRDPPPAQYRGGVARLEPRGRGAPRGKQIFFSLSSTPPRDPPPALYRGGSRGWSLEVAGHRVESRFFYFLVYLSYHTTHTRTAERRARNSAGAEALAVVRRPKESSREKALLLSLTPRETPPLLYTEGGGRAAGASRSRDTGW